MWVDAEPIQRDWHGGEIRISEVLYEFEGPVVFVARVGFNELLFAKRDEGELADFFLAVETNDRIVAALRQGKLSLRGALDRPEGWLIETDLRTINGFQSLAEGQFDDLLPQPKIALYSRYGLVPDTLEQAEAFIAFRFVGAAVQGGQVPLSVLQDKINDFAAFVKKALLPQALMTGRDYRFFDVEMAEPKFSSLVLAAKKPTFDEARIALSRRLEGVNPEALNLQAGNQGREFWGLLNRTLEQIDQTGELSQDFKIENQIFLTNLKGLIPSDDENLSRVEVTFNDGMNLHTAIIEGNQRRTIVAAQAEIEGFDVRTLVGVIIEVNGVAGTFIIKDMAERQTTCVMPRADFNELDDDNQLYRGRQVSITGIFTRRTRRDKLWIDGPIAFLN
ncbi:hypothetical protein [Qipengyuania sp.]|uniref:hypothetical protein n=1 Tax=Qipengyuania sp. TaxID=2004515 RepID=UPI0035C86B40